jgi:hypothetical protein
VELRRRGRVGVDPVDLVPVPVEEQEERRPQDLVPLEDFLAGLGPSGGAIEDEVILDELLVDGVGIVLLDQQFAGPSAAFLEEIEEQELVLGFCFGQGVFDRSGEPGLAVGRGDRKDEDEGQQRDGFFHLDLLDSEADIERPFSDRQYSPGPEAMSITPEEAAEKRG